MSDATNVYRRADTVRLLVAAGELLEELECGDLDDDEVSAAVGTIRESVNGLAADDVADIDKARAAVDRLGPRDLARALELFAAVEQLNKSLDELVWAVTLGKPNFSQGTPGALAKMLDRLYQAMRDQHVDQWRSPEVRASTEPVRDLLNDRLRGPRS